MPHDPPARLLEVIRIQVRIAERVDDILLVSEAALERAVSLLLQIEKTVVETVEDVAALTIAPGVPLTDESETGTVTCAEAGTESSSSASVVHAVAEWMRKNGFPFTRRGAGKPARFANSGSLCSGLRSPERR